MTLKVCRCFIFRNIFFSFENRIKGTYLAFTSILFPMIMPTIASTLFIRTLFHKNGIFNLITSYLGVASVNWLEKFPFIILLLLFLWKNLGYHVVVILAGLPSLEYSQMEAARIDGAGFFKLMYYIWLPHLKTFLSFSIIMSIIQCFQIFRESLQLFLNYQDESIYFLQNFIFNNFENLNFQRLAAASMIMLSLLGATQILLVWKGGLENHE